MSIINKVLVREILINTFFRVAFLLAPLTSAKWTVINENHKLHEINDNWFPRRTGLIKISRRFCILLMAHFILKNDNWINDSVILFRTRVLQGIKGNVFLITDTDKSIAQWRRSYLENFDHDYKCFH